MFKSENFIFRQTGMGAAFAELGFVAVPMVRETKLGGMLRDMRKDRREKIAGRQVVTNTEPSVEFILDPARQYHRDPPKVEPRHRVYIPVSEYNS